MEALPGRSTSLQPDWPGWGKAACFIALGIAAWASVILPVMYWLE
jgi:hypothetical protein